MKEEEKDVEQARAAPGTSLRRSRSIRRQRVRLVARPGRSFLELRAARRPQARYGEMIYRR